KLNYPCIYIQAYAIYNIKEQGDMYIINIKLLMMIPFHLQMEILPVAHVNENVSTIIFAFFSLDVEDAHFCTQQNQHLFNLEKLGDCQMHILYVTAFRIFGGHVFFWGGGGLAVW
ncbi:hypothetical protein ACJX0J_022132, partial [Zea mays]